MTRSPRLAALALATIMSVAACGQDTSIPEDVSIPLNAHVDRIEQSASTGDIAGAHQHAGELRSLVLELRAGGRLDAATADRLLGKVAAVETVLDTLPGSDTAATSPPASTTTPPPSTTSAAVATTSTRAAPTTTKPSPVTTPTKKPKPRKDSHDE